MSEKVTAAAKKPVAKKKLTKWQYTRREMKKNWVAYAMCAPFFILFFTFTVIPVCLSVVLSFTTFNMLEWPVFVGLSNYVRLLLEDDIFILAVKNTLVFAMITGPVSYLMSLMFAWFINELTPKVRALVTLIFYAPSISGNVYMIWTVLFSGDQYGYINSILLKLNMITTPIQFLTNTSYIMPMVIIVAL